MKTPKIILVGSLLLLAVAATTMAWQSYWKARWIAAVQFENDSGAAE